MQYFKLITAILFAFPINLEASEVVSFYVGQRSCSVFNNSFAITNSSTDKFTSDLLSDDAKSFTVTTSPEEDSCKLKINILRGFSEIHKFELFVCNTENGLQFRDSVEPLKKWEGLGQVKVCLEVGIENPVHNNQYLKIQVFKEITNGEFFSSPDSEVRYIQPEAIPD